MNPMGPRFSPNSTLLYAIFASLPLTTFAQSSFNGRCQLTSSPLQVRTEGLTERLGDISLACSGATAGSVVSGNLTIFLPVTITNRVDTNNQTHDAAIFVDSGSGFAPGAVPGTVIGNSISFNGLNFPAPAGSINLKISGIRGNVSQLGLGAPQPIVASLSSALSL